MATGNIVEDCIGRPTVKVGVIHFLAVTQLWLMVTLFTLLGIEV